MLAAMGLNVRRALAANTGIMGRVPDDATLPLMPLSCWTAVRTIFPLVIKAQIRVRRNRRELPHFINTVTERVAAAFSAIEQADLATALVRLWDSDLLPLFREAARALQAAISQLEDQTGKAQAC